VRVRWGYRRLHVLLKREGFRLGVSQAYRWYCLEQLQLRAWRKKRRKSTVTLQARMQPRRENDAWSMDFVADQLADGTKVRLLTIIDIFSRESLAIVVGHRLRGDDVLAALNRIVEKRPAPKFLFVDNGSEFWANCSISGPITIRPRSISAGRVSQPITASSRRSTVRCATNASTSIGSPPRPRSRLSWRPGGWTTMRFGLT